MKRQILNEHLQMKKNKSCQISRSQQNEFSLERIQSISQNKRSSDKGSMQIVEMWSKKMKKQCDSYLEVLKQKQQQEIMKLNHVPPIMLKNIDVMKRSDKTTLPRSRITSFNQQDPNLRSHKEVIQKNEDPIGTSIFSNSGRSNAQPFFFQRLKLSPIREVQNCIDQCDTLLQDVQSISKEFYQPKQDRFKLYAQKRQKEKLKEMFLLRRLQ
ncbi:unnamed protein product (macronuclear) [Paramecium tetraurelia]|uniref:Uncharacterized protein n=1 Tax=Paramecium tetraurelia TaxID=5888 RepID=A0BV60_PARTE|nr:uncharacterized protein GSPATT00005673001 [Paramecium tetraurelia]CAK62427.1 unnamed protein product [Paramecium tetraurelia]|eukprot:XP_001429825.1 hypothetical protein (macronuclear) [Paramecium tetraurelia strain d4-2]